MEFKPFPKLARLSRECIISEKLDGTNGQILIKPLYDFEGTEDVSDALGVFGGYVVFVGSRTRWIKPGKSTDNFGFASWVLTNIDQILRLGLGTHFGEWYGCGIQRGYDLHERRFALFNAARWSPAPLGGGVLDNADPSLVTLGPSCVHVVPTLYRGVFTSDAVEAALAGLREFGSRAVPGFKDAEGVVVYHVAAGFGFKKTLGSDGAKGSV